MADRSPSALPQATRLSVRSGEAPTADDAIRVRRDGMLEAMRALPGTNADIPANGSETADRSGRLAADRSIAIGGGVRAHAPASPDLPDLSMHAIRSTEIVPTRLDAACAKAARRFRGRRTAEIRRRCERPEDTAIGGRSNPAKRRRAPARAGGKR